MTAYPFCRLSGPANVLVMPAFHSASISTKMLQELGGATVIGPLLVGLDQPVQIVPLSAQRHPARQHGGAGGVQCERLSGCRAGGSAKRRTGIVVESARPHRLNWAWSAVSADRWRRPCSTAGDLPHFSAPPRSAGWPHRR